MEEERTYNLTRRRKARIRVLADEEVARREERAARKAHEKYLRKYGPEYGELGAIQPEVVHTICRGIEGGLFDYMACLDAELDPALLSAWLKKGRADRQLDKSTPHTVVLKLVERARAKREKIWLQQILNERDGKNLRWLLERANPEVFGGHTTQTLKTDGDEPVVVKVEWGGGKVPNREAASDG